MATRDFDPQEERKSYGAVFLVGTGLLVIVTLWSVWDDNITRRSWKRYQSDFYRLDYRKAKAAFDEEQKKLQADAGYQDLTKKLAAERASLERGELARRLAELKRKEATVDVRFIEIDQEVKFIKSELEEAWYEYDHAVQTGRNPKPYQATIQELEKEKAKLDPKLEAARQQREAIKQEIKNLGAGIKKLEDELAKVNAEGEKWQRVMENDTFKLGPLSFYKIPKIR